MGGEKLNIGWGGGKGAAGVKASASPFPSERRAFKPHFLGKEKKRDLEVKKESPATGERYSARKGKS